MPEGTANAESLGSSHDHRPQRRTWLKTAWEWSLTSRGLARYKFFICFRGQMFLKDFQEMLGVEVCLLIKDVFNLWPSLPQSMALFDSRRFITKLNEATRVDLPVE